MKLRNHYRKIFRMVLRENESEYTRYQLYRVWFDVVKSSLPFFWSDVVYPQKIMKRDSFDFGAFLSVVLFIGLVIFGIISVYPLFVRVYNWFTSVFYY